MKRFLCLALVACVCLGVCACFASCDGATDGEQNESSSENTATDEEQNESSSENTATEAPTDAATLEANFKEALSFKDVQNVTLELYTEYKDGILDESGSVIFYFDGNKTKSVSTYEHADSTVYYEKTDSEFYAYIKGENGWERRTANADAAGTQYTTLADYVSEFEYVNYDAYTYNGDVYYYIEKESGSTETIIIKIDGTRLVYIEMYIKNSEYEYTRRYEFSDYGTTKVDMPKDFVDVTAE